MLIPTRRGLLAGAAASSAYAALLRTGAGACPPPPTPPSAPSQASAAGFNTLVFDAEFASSSDVATSATQTTGAKLYWAPGCTPSFTVNPGALTLSGWSGSNFGQSLVTVPYNATSSVSTGCWNHGYFEASMQFNPVVQGTGAPGGVQEVSFWLKDVRNLSSGTYYFAECDIMEQYPNGTAGSSANTINTLHQWHDVSGSYTDVFNTNTSNLDASHQADSNPHTYGCLWTGNGTTGQVSFYFDNVLCTHQGGAQYYALNTAGSPTSAFTAMENTKMFINLDSASSGWPVVFGFIRVWQ
jgi:hypothetical protein